MGGFLLGTFCVFSYLAIGLSMEGVFARWLESNPTIFDDPGSPADPGMVVMLMLAWPMGLVFGLFFKLERISRASREREEGRRVQAEHDRRRDEEAQRLKDMHARMIEKYSVNVDQD